MSVTLYCGDAIEVMKTLEDNSIDLIATDPPYFKVKGDAWDRQWDKPADFLAWLDTALEQMARILKPNGSLYLFASPKMAARVEVLIGQRFNVLNQIVWRKETDRGKHAASCKETLRGYFPNTERIIFAEHYGADNIAKGEAGYAAKCDELRGFIFEPLRAYLDGERQRAGVSVRQVAEAFQRKTRSRTVTGMAGHWFTQVQWTLPTEANYEWLRHTLSGLNHGGEYLRVDYEELRVDYEELRVEYEELRRPFSVTADVPYTDVWTFPTVQAYAGKHPCEKPLPMMRHIIEASSKPGATVLDCFMGSGTTGIAAEELGRNFIGVELDAKYFAQAQKRMENVQPTLLEAAG